MTIRDNDIGHPEARDDYRYSKLALAWHGWGSPVGLGLFLVGIAAAGVLARFAIAGF